MNNGAFISYKEQIVQGWFNNQISELSRDLEILERYGHLTSQQHKELLKLAWLARKAGQQEESLASPAPIRRNS